MNNTAEILRALAEAEEHAANKLRDTVVGSEIETNTDEIIISLTKTQMISLYAKAAKLREIALRMESEQSKAISNP